MSRDYLACPRCGIMREVHLYRETALGMCRDCKFVEPDWPIVTPEYRHAIALCGTDSGYYRHLRTLDEPACDTCLKAHREVTLARARAHGVQPPLIAQRERRRREAAERVA